MEPLTEPFRKWHEQYQPLTVTLNFSRVVTEKQARNLIELIKKERRKVVRFSQMVDSNTFQPLFYCFAIAPNDQLGNSIKFVIDADETLTGTTISELIDADYSIIDNK